MKAIVQLKNTRRKRRSGSVRSRIRRQSTLPRLSVHRSSKHIYAQLIDDVKGHSIAHSSSTAKSLAEGLEGKNKTERAKVVGAAIAKLALDAGCKEVVFDRGHSKYHGRVKALADAAREAGLKF